MRTNRTGITLSLIHCLVPQPGTASSDDRRALPLDALLVEPRAASVQKLLARSLDNASLITFGQ